MKRDCIIITGSSGLIGSAVARRLETQYAVICFDRVGAPHPPAECDCVNCDLTSDQSVRDALRRVRDLHGNRIASVIHLAAYYDFSGEPSPKYEEVTVRGTERLLRGLKDFEVGQFVFSSTMILHAPCRPGERINEEWPLEPKWDYPKSKVETEKLIHDQRGDIPTVMLRIAGVYDEDGHSIPLVHQMKRIDERELVSHVFPGDTSHGQSFLHLDDLVDAICRGVERRAALPPELVVLLGEPETLSYEELQRTFGRLIHGEDWETRQIPKALAKTGAWLQDKMPVGEEPFIKPWMIDLADDHFALDISRARHALVWEPKRSLRATLPAMVNRLKADPLAWYKENKMDPPSGLEEPAGDTHPRKTGLTPELKQTLMDVRAQRLGQAGASVPDSRIDAGTAAWAAYATIILGTWLLSGAFTFDQASAAMKWNDLICGALIIGFAALSRKPRQEWARWANAGVGCWLLLAPLVFWANAAAYHTDTLIGTLVVIFSVVLPGAPGESKSPGPEIPPGWSYNPSVWMQRAPVIAMAFLGFYIARYLAAYQLGHIDTVWDPFFKDGTRNVLESDVSRAFPVSDAGLGACSYLIEMLTGCIGGTGRWRTMPWMVIFFGILVVPLGVVSIVLVMLQPVAVGAWCALCLVTALAMLVMISPAADEVVATVQFLRRSRRAGQAFWPTFWKGGTLGTAASDMTASPSAASSFTLTSALGIHQVTWTLVFSALLGIWLMFAPAMFHSQGTAANNDYLVGALVITFAVIGLGEITRSARWLNLLLGAWLIVAPWVLTGGVTGSRWNNVIVGVLLIGLTIPRGQVKERFGTFDRYIV